MQEELPQWQGEVPFSKFGGAELGPKNPGFGQNDLLSLQQMIWLSLYRLAEFDVPARSEVSVQIKVTETSNYMVKLPSKPLKQELEKPVPPKIKVVVDRDVSPWPKTLEMLDEATGKWIPLLPGHFQNTNT